MTASDEWKELAEATLKQFHDGPVDVYRPFTYLHPAVRVGEDERIEAVCMTIPYQGEAYDLLLNKKYQIERIESIRKVLPEELIAFIGQLRLSPPGIDVDVVIGPGTTQFDILKMTHTLGLNISRLDIEEILKRYDRNYGINIYYADLTSVNFQLKTLPTDLLGFAKEITSICPDFGDTEELAKSIKTEHVAGLWWNL